MNMSNCISHLLMQLGLYNIVLPFTDENGKTKPTENVIRDVLTVVTIPIYSQFCPLIKEGTIALNKLKCVDKKQSIYLLPAFLTLTPVMYINDVSMPFINNRGTYGDIAPAYGINRSVEGVITSQAYMMLAGQMRAEPTFELIKPNKVKLYGYPNCELTFSVACQHDPNGETIEDSCYDSFMELAMLDVKMFLYNNLKYFDGIPTAFGEIKLKIEDYQSAESDRNQLLDRWRDTFHVDMQWDKWM